MGGMFGTGLIGLRGLASLVAVLLVCSSAGSLVTFFHSDSVTSAVPAGNWGVGLRDGTPLIAAQDHSWYKTILIQSMYESAVAGSESGIHLTGSISGLGLGRTDTDIYVASLGLDGGLQWFKTIGGTSWDDFAFDLAVHGDSIYVTGYARRSMLPNVFVARLSISDGGLRWFKVVGGVGEIYYTNGLALNGDNIYVTGYLDKHVFVASLSSSDGSLRWFRMLTEDSREEAYDIAAYGDSVYITGDISWSGGTDGFVASLTALNGSLQWFRAVEGVAAKSIAVDGNGVYVAGETVSFGAGGTDAYVAHLAFNGSLRWFRTIGGADYDKANGIALHENSLYVAGRTDSFGARDDAFVACLALNGSLGWFKRISGGGAQSIVVNSNGVYIAGRSSNGTYVARLLQDYLSSDNPEDLRWTANEKWPPVSVDAANPSVMAQTPMTDSHSPTVDAISPAVGTDLGQASVSQRYPETHIADMAVSDAAPPSFPWGWVISGVAAAAVASSILIVWRRKTL
jgi:hypothetical protein